MVNKSCMNYVQDSEREPEDDECCDCDGGHEGVGESVVAGLDASPVLEPSEHDLDLVVLAVARDVVRDGDFAVTL